MSRYARDPISGSILPIAGGGSTGTGGHTIVDENGISYPARANLKIENATIQDDSTNNTTVVTPDGGNDIGLYIDETTGLVYQRWEVN